MMWSKMKEALRKLRIRIADDLPAAVKEILEHNITRENCVGWFRKDGTYNRLPDAALNDLAATLFWDRF